MNPQLVMLRALGLGDFLTGVPAYRALRRAFPEHHLVLAAPAALAGLADLTGAIDEVLDTPGLVPLRWHRLPPSMAVNLHGRGPHSHELLSALAPDRLLGFRTGRRDGPEWREDEHEADRWCRLLEHHDIPADPGELRLPAPSEPPLVAGVVIVHPGAAYGCRRWPPDRFGEVARQLADRGHRVVVTGGPAEQQLTNQVADRAGLDPDAVLAGTTTHRQLAALVAHAELVICGDTGVGHLATALGTPSVLLFGPTPPCWWGPRTGGPHRVLWHDEYLRGDRWAPTPDPALLAITPQEVLAAAVPLISRASDV